MSIVGKLGGIEGQQTISEVITPGGGSSDFPIAVVRLVLGETLLKEIVEPFIAGKLVYVLELEEPYLADGYKAEGYIVNRITKRIDKTWDDDAGEMIDVDEYRIYPNSTMEDSPYYPQGSYLTGRGDLNQPVSWSIPD